MELKHKLLKQLHVMGAIDRTSLTQEALERMEQDDPNTLPNGVYKENGYVLYEKSNLSVEELHTLLLIKTAQSTDANRTRLLIIQIALAIIVFKIFVL